jgi:dynein heavy chain
VLQTHARQYKIAIDKLDFTFEILDAEGPDDIDTKPEDGVYIYGLFIESARWDAESGHLADSIPGKMIEKMPVIHFIPKEDFKIDPEDYASPLYKTSLRAGVLSTTGQSTNFVLYVAIPTKEIPDTWVQRATALLCMLDD